MRRMDVAVDLERRVPFLDLGRQNASLVPGLLAEIETLLRSSQFINGPHVAEFERAFGAYCQTTACVGTSSGLDALRLALAALDIGPGDEVLVPAMTFVATFEAVSQVGAIPVPVDVREDDYCLDATALPDALTPNTRAVVPVHLYGQMANMEGLVGLAARHDLRIVEDACQAHGARRQGRGPGAETAAAAFSFYPGKNLGAIGDAGAVVTDDVVLAARIRSLREHGQHRKYHHDEIGWTARLDTIQALTLLAKLPLLEEWNAERCAIAALYHEALADVGDLTLPGVPPESSPVWHLYVVRTADPDGLAGHLTQTGVATGRHYPEPPHLSRAYAELGYREGAFPVAEAIARSCLSLPVFPGMTESQVLRVVEGVSSWFGRG
jgi:dTDP-4-amino-4,6-dideoxygalactose transaminase